MLNRLLSRAVAACAIAALVSVSIPVYASEAAPAAELTIVERTLRWLSGWSPFPLFAKSGDEGESGDEPEAEEGDDEATPIVPFGYEGEEEPGNELGGDLQPGG